MQEEIIILPHFKPEEIEALRQEHERQKQVFLGHALLDNDSERIREASQRMIALEANHQTETDDYAECLYEIGRIEEAIALVQDVRKKKRWQARLAAILRPDDKFCPCPEFVEVPDGREGKRHISTSQVVRRYPSAKHGGKLTPVIKCTQCGDENVTNE